MEANTRRDVDATAPHAYSGVYSDTTKPSPDSGLPAGDRDRSSIGGLLKELRDETTTLMRQELALAKTEMSEKASKAGRNAASVASGGVVALIGGTIICQALAVAAALLLVWLGMEVHGWWVGPLIVGAIIAAIGYSMLQKGLSTLKDMSPAPEKTIDSLKENKEWLKDKTTR
jgi:hypothetical protein